MPESFFRFPTSNDWMRTGSSGVRHPARVQRLHQRLFQRKADLREIRRVLGLGTKTDGATLASGVTVHLHQEIDDLLKRGHLEPSVVGGAAQVGEALPGPEGLELLEGEVLGEPACHLPAGTVQGHR